MGPGPGLGDEGTMAFKSLSRVGVMAAGAAGLTVGYGEFGPLAGLPHLLAIFSCFHLDPAKVYILILLPQVQYLQGARLLTLWQVQGDPVLVVLMEGRPSTVVDELPMELCPSQGHTHSGILG